MLDFFKFFIFLSIGLQIFSAASDECEDGCSDKNTKPTVDEDGRILMTVWYDNDNVDDPAQWSANMVRKACEALDTFHDKFFVEFVIGAGTTVDDGDLVCKHDCNEDRLEGCAALLLGCWKFPKFVCCNNTKDAAKKCAEDLGLDPEILDDCVKHKKSDQFLIFNGDRRRRAGIPDCHVPEFSFNGVVDRCIKIPTFDDLKAAICDIFKRGDISVKACSD